jgi:hypothetical protein
MELELLFSSATVMHCVSRAVCCAHLCGFESTLALVETAGAISQLLGGGMVFMIGAKPDFSLSLSLFLFCALFLARLKSKVGRNKRGDDYIEG